VPKRARPKAAGGKAPSQTTFMSVFASRGSVGATPAPCRLSSASRRDLFPPPGNRFFLCRDILGLMFRVLGSGRCLGPPLG